MAKNLYALIKSESQGELVIDGVRCVLVTLDGSFSDADIRATAIGQLNARVGRDMFPLTYFDKCLPKRISDLTNTGYLGRHLDCLMIGARAVERIRS